MLHFIVNWLAGTPSFAAPYALAALGLIISERAGRPLARRRRLHAGRRAGRRRRRARAWRPSSVALVVAMLAAAVVSLLFALLVVVLRVNQVIAGLAIVFFCQGLTSLVGTLAGWTNRAIAGLHEVADLAAVGHPVVGRILFTPGRRRLPHHPDLLCRQLCPDPIDARPAAALGRRKSGSRRCRAASACRSTGSARSSPASALIGLAGGYLSVVDVEALGSRHQRRPRLDRDRACHLRPLAALARPVRRFAVRRHRGAHSAHRRRRDSVAAIFPADDAVSRHHRGHGLGGGDEVRPLERTGRARAAAHSRGAALRRA